MCICIHTHTHIHTYIYTCISPSHQFANEIYWNAKKTLFKSYTITNSNHHDDLYYSVHFHIHLVYVLPSNPQNCAGGGWTFIHSFILSSQPSYLVRGAKVQTAPLSQMDGEFEERPGIYRGWLHLGTQRSRSDMQGTQEFLSWFMQMIRTRANSTRFTETWQLGREDAILEPSHQVGITGMHDWQLAGAADSHLVKEKYSCSTAKYLGDSLPPC